MAYFNYYCSCKKCIVNNEVSTTTYLKPYSRLNRDTARGAFIGGFGERNPPSLKLRRAKGGEKKWIKKQYTW